MRVLNEKFEAEKMHATERKSDLRDEIHNERTTIRQRTATIGHLITMANNDDSSRNE